MLRRVLPLFLAAVALVLIAGRQARAGEETHQGTVVKAGDGKLAFTVKGEDKKHNHDVAKDAKITLDGKEAKLEDLKEGYSIVVIEDEDKDVVIKITALSKESKDK